MPKKKKKRGRVYFGMDVQDAIVRYNDSDNNTERNRIYLQYCTAGNGTYYQYL